MSIAIDLQIILLYQSVGNLMVGRLAELEFYCVKHACSVDVLKLRNGSAEGTLLIYLNGMSFFVNNLGKFLSQFR